MTDESIWSKAQPRGISRSLPRRKTGLASNTKKSYIKSKSHCLIFYQSIVGGLYTIISEGKFTQSLWEEALDNVATVGYNVYVMSGSKAPDFDAYGLQKLIDITVKAPDKVVYI